MQHRLWFVLIWVLALVWPISSPSPVTAQNCTNEAELVEQDLDPAGGVLAPESDFTVTWTLRNAGDCTWSREYRLRFASGDRMESPRSTRLRTQIETIELLTLSLELVAPAEPGDYRGVWRLRSADGESFGPELEVAIQVADDVALSSDEVVLPEVLVFGGKGGGGDEGALVECIQDGALPETPLLAVDDEWIEDGYATLYLCSLPEGAEVTVEIVDPDGNAFSRAYVEDAPTAYMDEDGVEYSGTVLIAPLAWPQQAPSGAWELTVTTEEFTDSVVITVPDPAPPVAEDEPYPVLDNWPLTPIDPFAAAEGCNYAYAPGQEMMLVGAYLPPDATLHLGIYQERMGDGYLAGQETVRTDGEGAFALRYAAPGAGEYVLALMEQVDPAGYGENGIQYDFGLGGDQTAGSCFTVTAQDQEEIPWRMAFASGTPGLAEVQVLLMANGAGYYPTFTYGECDASEPAWWPGGEWVIYQSNCVPGEDADGFATQSMGDYDLYARQLDFSYMLSEEETTSRLTATPDVDETEPDANLDGLIVYRQAPAGSAPDASGELWLLDIFEETASSLGLSGRGPTWSPDGSRIAFMSDLEGSWQVYVYDVETEEVWLASEGCETHCRFPAWSPDGRQVIYSASTSLQDLTPNGLWIAPAEGGRPRLWLSGEYGRPTWSAEGWIAFNGTDGIYRAQAGRRNGKVERYLYRDPAQGYLWAPVWSR